MGHVEFEREPPANLTTLVMAFGGWIDAGQAATGALGHLGTKDQERSPNQEPTGRRVVPA